MPPPLCPRMLLHLTEKPVADDGRVMRHGTLDQVRRDLAAMLEMGAQYVLSLPGVRLIDPASGA